jgi:hypothetical protein
MAALTLAGAVVGEERAEAASGCATVGQYCVELDWSCTRLGVAPAHTVQWTEKDSATVVGSVVIDGSGTAPHTIVKGLSSSKSYNFTVFAHDPYTATSFTSNQFTVTTVATGDVSTITAASFTDTAGTIGITFDQATNRGGHGGTRFKCSKLLTTMSSIKVGGGAESAYCQFSSPTMLTVELMSESTVIPGDIIGIKPNAIAKLVASPVSSSVTLQYLGGNKTVAGEWAPSVASADSAVDPYIA